MLQTCGRRTTREMAHVGRAWQVVRLLRESSQRVRKEYKHTVHGSLETSVPSLPLNRCLTNRCLTQSTAVSPVAASPISSSQSGACPTAHPPWHHFKPVITKPGSCTRAVLGRPCAAEINVDPHSVRTPRRRSSSLVVTSPRLRLGRGPGQHRLFHLGLL